MYCALSGPTDWILRYKKTTFYNEVNGLEQASEQKQPYHIYQFKEVTWLSSTLFGCLCVCARTCMRACRCIRSSLHSVHFRQLLRCAHKRIVNIMKMFHRKEQHAS